jgi:type IV pilus assembly protein PilB
MLTKEALIDALKSAKQIPDKDLARALEMHKIEGGKFSQILVREGLISEEELAALVSEKLGIPILNLSLVKIDPEVIRMIPKKIAQHYELIPISRMGQALTVAMSDPLNIFALDDVREITGCLVRPIVTTSKDIQAALEQYFEGSAEIDEVLEDMPVDDVELVKEDRDEGETPRTSRGTEAPAIKLMGVVLREALKRRASDIHMEIYENDFRIRYRIDGALTEGFSPPREMHGPLLSRLKIMSNLDITERRVPQDGRFRIKHENREIDFRVSVLPLQCGEKAVLRVLDRSSITVGLDRLGFHAEPLAKFKEAIKKPYGMILVTGPTGSGKSTSLYAVLNALNTPMRNIMTVEDPVEYQIEGITQTQVLSDIGLTFANGLRSILRQSPDIILVGEIRDSETADIAVKAALTGHLVLSTLHTNSASGACTRLVDMKVEPFLIASSVILVTAQRLMRRICQQCREPYAVPQSAIDQLRASAELMKQVKAFHGRGCKACNHTGYYGRLGTMEALWVDEDIRNLVLERRSSDEIQGAARRAGMKTLFENAFEAFKQGETTLEEVLRVTSE